GGIVAQSGANVTLVYSIVAGNYLNVGGEVASDFSGSVNDVSSYNLIGSGSGMSGIGHGSQGNLIGTMDAPIDPQLGPLQDNGGTTLTHELLEGSPAIDAGVLGDALDSDQTGALRPLDGDGDGSALPDFGAVEHPAVVLYSDLIGFVYEDRFGDGVYDPNTDLPFGGISVVLTADLNHDDVTESWTTISDPIDGRYRFSELLPGNYRLTVDGNAAVATTVTDFTITLIGNQQIVAETTLADSSTATIVTDSRLAIGLVRPTELRGVVWHDQTADGITAEDVGLANVTVSLWLDNGDGLFDANDQQIEVVATDLNGAYVFQPTYPGAYWIETTTPDFFDPIAVGEVTTTRLVSVESGQTLDTLDFAVARQGSIIGQVREAAQHTGLANRTIQLLNSAGTVLAETQTDESGGYTFAGLAPGTYQVQEVLPEQWEPAAPTSRFAAGENVPGGFFIESLLTGDLNNDGSSDLVIVNDTTSPLDQTTSVVVRHNNDFDGFSAAQEIALPLGARPSDAVLADMNGDGRLDLVLSSLDRWNDGVDSSGVLILTNDGTGRFQLSESMSAVTNPMSLAVADYNGDGILDIATAHPAEQMLSVWLANGAGTFVATSPVSLQMAADHLTAADVNGDGRTDLLLLDYLHSELQVWQNV
ncbi:MAG: VCBS repeat-containing protein, partial [Planctomycetales bacterium]|nr:VCBS repeat-containing protein [Planctomycetales bacterium]